MPVIKTHNLSYSYSEEENVLKNLNIEITQGERVAIIGQNGAGKTTLVKHFNGLLKPKTGNVLVKGTDTREKTTAQLARWIGFVFQNPDDQIFKSSVEAEISFGPEQIGMDEEKTQKMVEKAAQMTGLSDQLKTNPYDLSISERKFVSIASVLAMDPEIIVLDEPTAGQSDDKIELIENIIQTLHQENKTQIIITHDMKMVSRNFDRIIVLRKGEVLLEGKTDYVFSKPELLEKSYLKPPPLIELSTKLGLPFCFSSEDFLKEFIKSTSEN